MVDGDDRLEATRGERLPRARVGEEPLTIGSTDGNDLTISGGRATYSENGAGDELAAEMDAEVKALKLYWEGDACQAFGQYAERTLGYLAELEAQARWLAEEGKKAASMLEGLRNAYAILG